MKFVLYSKNNCPHCVEAKRKVTDHAEKYATKEDKEIVDIFYVDSDPSKKDELLDRIRDIGLAPPRTVPQIFYRENKDSDWEYVGSNSDLGRFLKRKVEEIHNVI